jgi:hypothetical protein
MRILLLASTMLVILSSCRSKNDEKAKLANITLFAPPKPVADKEDVALENLPPVNPLADTAKKIIKTGELSFETDQLAETRKKIIKSVIRLDGFVAEDSQNFNQSDNRKEFVLDLRLPSKNFDLLVASVTDGVDKIDSKRISVKDVTTSYIDIQTALFNHRMLEKTYLDLLNKVSKIQDVLAIENKISQIRTTIDSTKGELNYLSRQVAYSDIKITFYSSQLPQLSEKTLGFRVKSSINDGWNLMENAFLGIVGLWPFLILCVSGLIVFRRWKERPKPANDQA